MYEIHPFKPIFDENSKVLILGSFPSVKSRTDNFYYAHPQNRFWKILSKIYSETISDFSLEKKQFLLKHNIAIWDVIKECYINNSADSSVKDVTPNNIEFILKNSQIKRILCNGNTSYKYYNKYFKDIISLDVVCLTSSSPANAKYSLDDLVVIWEQYFNNF